jgi:hypothetical protein
MTILWFSVDVSIQYQATIVFVKYYFSVDDETSTITAFYNYDNIGTDILGPATLPNPFPNSQLTANNIFNINTLEFTYNGTNFTDPTLQTTLNNNTPYYSFFYIEPNAMYQYTLTNNGTQDVSTTLSTNYIDIVAISGPPDPIPIANICFLCDTRIETDQGFFAIQEIDPQHHTIRQKPIVNITKTYSLDNTLICFEKHSLGKDIPSAKTTMSKYHKIWYEGRWREAHTFKHFANVEEIKYNGEILYNVLLENHEAIHANHIICETLHPDNVVAKLYGDSHLDKTQKNDMIIMMNNSIVKGDYPAYKKWVHRLIQ